MDTIFITYRLDSYKDDIRELISSLCGRRVSLQHWRVPFAFGWLFTRGRFGGQSFRSTRYSLQAKVQRPRAPWIFLICLPYTRKWTWNQKNGRLEDDVPFSNAVILRFYAYFQECLESSEPNTNQQKHIDDVSGKQPMRRTMPCRTNWLLALASSFICTFIMRRSQSKCYDDKTEGIWKPSEKRDSNRFQPKKCAAIFEQDFLEFVFSSNCNAAGWQQFTRYSHHAYLKGYGVGWLFQSEEWSHKATGTASQDHTKYSWFMFRTSNIYSLIQRKTAAKISTRHAYVSSHTGIRTSNLSLKSCPNMTSAQWYSMLRPNKVGVPFYRNRGFSKQQEIIESPLGNNKGFKRWLLGRFKLEACFCWRNPAITSWSKGW